MEPKRRLLVTALAAAPWLVRAQAALPLIGVLNADSNDDLGRARVALIRRGLQDAGVVEGRDAELTFLWADGRYERLRAMADSLVRRKAAVIFASSLPGALAAKAASREIPIVFIMGADPVQQGVVASMQRPGGNLTGVSQLYGTLGAKRVELLRELVPSLKAFAVLSNPANPNAKAHASKVEEAAARVGMQATVFNVSTEREIEAAFAGMVRKGLRAVLIADDPYFNLQRVQIVGLAAKHALPAIYFAGYFVAAGGLVSYGSYGSENTGLATAYVARVLKGEKPASLPVMQSTKFALAINMKTAKALGIVVPPGLRLMADEVIE